MDPEKYHYGVVGLFARAACDRKHPTRGMRYVTRDTAKVTCRRCLRVLASRAVRALGAIGRGG